MNLQCGFSSTAASSYPESVNKFSPAKGRVTVVMGKTEYNDKMNALVNDKQTYEELEIQPPHCNSNLTTNCSNLHDENRQNILSTLQQTEL